MKKCNFNALNYFIQKASCLIILCIVQVPGQTFSQCSQQYDWAVWDNFSGDSTSGTITSNGQDIAVTMSANFQFGASNEIFNYNAFASFSEPIPNSTVPETTWSFGTGGVTTMCFSQTVSNPVLLLASIGREGIPVTLQFSRKYNIAFPGQQVIYSNDSTIIGEEGYTILIFPGDFDCVTIFSTTPEYYTNITWGLNPPLFPITVDGDLVACDSTVLLGSGGSSYSWSGGENPSSASNIIKESGNYFLTVTDINGCTVVTSRTVKINSNHNPFLGKDTAICGTNMYQLTSPSDNTLWFDQTIEKSKTIFESGTYWASFLDINGCESKDSVSVQFNSIIKAYIPNVFSPNDDGINDIFLPNFSEVDFISYKFKVFDRWGNLIFFTTELNNKGWDGRCKEKECNPGEYVYLVEVEKEFCSITTFKGGVTLMK